MKRRLLWQVFPTFILVIVAGLSAISWHVSQLFRDFYRHEKQVQLEHLVHAARHYFEEILGTDSHNAMQAACDALRDSTGYRYTLIDLQGNVLADSDQDPEVMENHLMRPEVQAALDGRTGSDIRTSRTLQQELLYVGLPLADDGRTAAVLRVAVPLVDLHYTTRRMMSRMFRYGLVIALLLAVVSFALSWKISRPLEQLRRGAMRFAAGDLSHRLPAASSDEIGTLAASMNQMAAQLDDRIRSIMQQRNEQQAVLSSMVEGVLAVDTNGRLISVNDAAAEMLNIDPQKDVDLTLEEVVRNTRLQRFIRRAMDSIEPIEEQMVIQPGTELECHLHVHGAPLRSAADDPIGALVVLNDITRIHRLEQIRRDFVANVSHELKTPITSIKGFIETLLDGAKDNPEDCRRFLEIIARQAHRLDSIIDDLLTLSRVEQQSEDEQLDISPCHIKTILTAAADLCRPAATDKDIQIQITCQDALEVPVNASLLEQAVVNLIDNAVKYSSPGGAVHVQADCAENEVLISVRDQGCGIAAEHLPRLFERFYRVDKARSRTLGGTGLGLSIVKHIVHYHKGQISVESRPNEGSTFTLHLPTGPSRLAAN